MNLQFRNFVARGQYDKERVTFVVKDDLEIGDFAILQCSRDGDRNLTTDVRRAFWFPNKKIQKGDIVVIYSKTGGEKEKALDQGRKAHFYYWDESMPIWDDADLGAVILHAPEYEAHFVDDDVTTLDSEA